MSFFEFSDVHKKQSKYYTLHGKRHKYYYESGERLPCFIRGIAYDELVDDDNKGVISQEIMNCFEPGATHVKLNCGYDISKQDEIYKEPAIGLTIKDVNSMPLVGGKVEYDHSKSGGKGVIGSITQTWVDGKKLNIEAAIHDASVAKGIRSKQLRGISMGYTVLKNGNRVLGKVFREVSICPEPVFPDCQIYINASRTENSSVSLNDESIVSGSGFYIDSLYDKPIENQIKFLNNDICDVGSLFKLPVRTASSSSAKKMEQVPTGFAQQTQPSATQAPPPVAQAPPVTDTTLEGQGGAKIKSGKEDKASDNGGREDKSYLKEKEKNYLKTQKYEEYKRIAKQVEAEKAAKRQQYLATQATNKDAFLGHYAQLIKEAGRDMTEEEKTIIERSYSTLDFEKWAQGLDYMREKQTKLAEENAQLKKNNEALMEQENTLKRKLEKTKGAVKFLRLNNGEKVKVKQPSTSDETKEKNSDDSPYSALFSMGKNTAGGFSQQGNNNNKKQAYNPIENAFMKATSSIDVSASRSSGGGYMSQMPEDLKKTLDIFNAVDPAEDAWQYLKKVPSYQPGVSMVRSAF